MGGRQDGKSLSLRADINRIDTLSMLSVHIVTDLGGFVFKTYWAYIRWLLGEHCGVNCLE